MTAHALAILMWHCTGHLYAGPVLVFHMWALYLSFICRALIQVLCGAFIGCTYAGPVLVERGACVSHLYAQALAILMWHCIGCTYAGLVLARDFTSVEIRVETGIPFINQNLSQKRENLYMSHVNFRNLNSPF